MEDAKYPIYSIGAKWLQDGVDDLRGRWYPFPPPEGRMWNSTSFHRMYKDDPGEESVRKWALEEWWPGYDEEKHPNASDLTITITRSEETWCLEWFQHKTFDAGQTDSEALASFERYVRRYEFIQDIQPGEIPDGYRCLMGAEDRWRWSGGPTAQDKSEPPCRCEHCKKQGVIRIGH